MCAGPILAQSPEVGVRLGVNTDGTRVVIDSGTRLSATTEAPLNHRLTFILSGLYVGQPVHGGGQGVVKGWWLDASEDGARLTLDLAGVAVVAHRFAIPPGADSPRFRYVIDLARPIAPPPAAPVRLATARHATLHRPSEVSATEADPSGPDPTIQSADFETSRRCARRHRQVATRATPVQDRFATWW